MKTATQSILTGPALGSMVWLGLVLACGTDPTKETSMSPANPAIQPTSVDTDLDGVPDAEDKAGSARAELAPHAPIHGSR